ncbi:hypothetical protein FB106_12120 [Synechococcus sp. Ace-Pa]|nr:hypothetical protein FB106_12120 [Synechococcus sp. Ace-Pa]
MTFISSARCNGSVGLTAGLTVVQEPLSLWLASKRVAGTMLSKDLTGKPWAVTPEKIAEAVRRLVAAAAPTRLIAFGSAAAGDLSVANVLDLLVVEAQVADRYQEMLRLRRVLRGLLMPIDLIVTSQALYDSRAQVPGTVEFAARTQGRVLYAGD